ncbi:glycosyltransferase family 2 protein [Enterococcus sp. BWB1-3]|uniref:glycosyltransferase family 2 protein n=1 Tax=unclassified Enterococcus TaxID=2608891 RepID=UPI001920D800|nr:MULTISPECIES: glycosyltransferase family 2 protein [unclassified Enterococcus]MBL1230764.1 glycosyltransferase family 2 protein [Enterococcus sp. BWB1-3]MCB5953231.1 glycosyltransferase family 2 protein [Enterococcus sp. BWT-B8]MCB5956221.1 glycosyltransferase family 2 protein [Enterococcus sp. CWB-B31]
MISVCIATYNGQKFISAQLDSILPQLGAKDEVIVSDDGSSDETITIINEYVKKDKRIRLTEGPRQGVIANFNWAVSQSAGEFIFLADQDDVWLPEKVDKILGYFSEHPEAELVVSDLTIVDEGLKPIISSYFDYRKVKQGFWTNFMKSGYIGAGMCLRASLKKKILPIPYNVPMHDMWIGLISEYYHSSAFLKEPLTYYRRHEENVSEIATSSSAVQKITWRLTLIYLLIQRLFFKR